MKKKSYLVCLIFIVNTTIGLSQIRFDDFKFGAKLGLNIANLRGDIPSAINETTPRIGFNIGGFAEYPIDSKLSLQLELLISTQGSNFTKKDNYYNSTMGNYSESFTQSPKLTYLNLPIMIKYNVIEKLSLEFGPQIGYLLSAKSKWEYIDSTNPNDNETLEIDLLKDATYDFGGVRFIGKGSASRIDFGLNLGANYEISSKIFANARYNYGLSNLDKNSTNGTALNSWNLKNSVVQMSLGYRF